MDVIDSTNGDDSDLAGLEAKLIQSLDGPARDIAPADWDKMDEDFEKRHAARASGVFP